MKYIVIGLGNFGSVISEELTLIGDEVVGVDNDPSHINNIKDKVATVISLDATKPDMINMLPLKDVDAVVVAIGDDFGASVKVVSLLKKNGVQNIFARAIDDVHKAVLESLGVDNILTPEQDAAAIFAESRKFGNTVNSHKIVTDLYLIKVTVSAKFNNTKLSDMKIEKNYNIKILSVIRPQNKTNIFGTIIKDNMLTLTIDDSLLLLENDILVMYGYGKDLKPFLKIF